MRKSRRSSVSRDIRVIRQSLSSIIRALNRLAPLLGAVVAGSSNPKGLGRTLNLSAERRAALRQQGQYMGALRGLKPRQKARVKALRAAKGALAAIRLAKRLAKG